MKNQVCEVLTKQYGGSVRWDVIDELGRYSNDEVIRSIGQAVFVRNVDLHGRVWAVQGKLIVTERKTSSCAACVIVRKKKANEMYGVR